MRKLLVVGAVGVLAIAAGLWQPSDSSAASLSVVSYLYHPTGQTTTAYLSCGWHSKCDGIRPDSNPYGLDWRPCGLTPTSQPCPSDQYTWLRLWSYTLGGSGYVGPARSFNQVLFGCPGISSELTRWSNANQVVATVRNGHSSATSQTYLNVYASQNGTKSSAVVGSFLNPGPDPCSSYWHTMQWYISGPYDDNWYRNASALPDETQCIPDYCARAYGVWNAYEYVFTFGS